PPAALGTERATAPVLPGGGGRRHGREVRRRSDGPGAVARGRRPDQPGGAQRGAVPAGAAAAARPEGAVAQEGGPPAGDGRVGGRRGAVGGAGVRSVRPACRAAGQDDPGAVLQGGQGSALDHRVGPGRQGGPAGSDVLLHADRVGCTDDPGPLRGSLECGGDALQRQADDGPGGPVEPDGAGGGADGAGGAGAVRTESDLVPRRGGWVRVFSRSGPGVRGGGGVGWRPPGAGGGGEGGGAWFRGGVGE